MIESAMGPPHETDEFDAPWKTTLDALFPRFLELLFPAAHAGIDWSGGWTMLESELQKIAGQSEMGARHADRLAQVKLHGSGEAWILVHVEIQGRRDPDFAERMFVYNYRAYDVFRRPIVSLAVLADENRSFRPRRFTYGLWGSEMRMRFATVKLIDLDPAMLAASRNPFATVVEAPGCATDDAGLRAPPAIQGLALPEHDREGLHSTGDR